MLIGSGHFDINKNLKENLSEYIQKHIYIAEKELHRLFVLKKRDYRVSFRKIEKINVNREKVRENFNKS